MVERFCAWLAWSRFRVVIPVWDQTMGTPIACLDETLRRIGGLPAYLVGYHAKTVTVEHIAGVAVRHPTVAPRGRYYGDGALERERRRRRRHSQRG